MMNVTLIPILSDNYAYLLEAEDGAVAVLDPGEAGPVIEVLEDKNLKPDMILNTHHHSDHIGGNAEIKNKYGAQIIGPAKDKDRIGPDQGLREGDDFSFGGEQVQILETPGHTLGGICFYFPESKAVFTGDTLFVMGCGRVFEGTMEQMWDSLSKIMALPDETKIYCGHEYTQANGNFCLTVEPDNTDLQDRMKDIRALRDQGKPTIPSIIALEKKTNSFVRAGSAARFAEIRKEKDAA